MTCWAESATYQARCLLPSCALHLWVLPLVGVDAGPWEAVLSEAERVRYRRFSHVHSRDRFVLGRAAARHLLSACYPDVTPDSWVFAINEHGRPHPVYPALPSRPAFNLSHSGDCLVLALCVGGEPGVDVEDTWRSGRLLEVADRYFSEREVAGLHALPSEERVSRFFSLWTLKEAWVKACGKGMTIPLRHSGFAPDEPQGIGVEFAPKLEQSPSDWQFWQLSVYGRYRIALAIRRRPGKAPWHLSVSELTLPSESRPLPLDGPIAHGPLDISC